MVTAFLEFDHRVTTIASLPALLFSCLDECFGLGILGTLARCVHLLRANTAHLHLTLFATSNLATILHADIVWFNPGPALSTGTIYPILRLVFLKLSVPQDLEFLVEQFLNMFEVNVLVCTASGWHMGWVRDGHIENALQA